MRKTIPTIGIAKALVTFFVIIGTLCSFAGLAYVVYEYDAGDPPYIAEVVTDAKLRRAMRYHGILAATWEGGEWWFERDGMKCRLYGEMFERWWNDEEKRQ